jgi:dolichol-phosphate mannosyltransferase
MFKKLSNNKQLKYLVLGGITAVFNLVVIWLLVELFRLDTPLQRNFANLVAIEISLIFSFFVYRLGVWTQASSDLRQILFRQLPLYHLSTSLTVMVRSFLIFPILDWLGVDYVINTLIGIGLGAFLSYFFNDQLVFSK